MRYLAIDHGLKRTGLAICDSGETITSPLEVIIGQKDLLNKIADLVRAQGVEAIVVGLPLNMDDSQGPQARIVLKFAEQLAEHVDVPIDFQDERLSSFGAEEKLQAMDFKRKKKKKLLDAVAAAEILQAYLDRKHAQ